nr:MAG TPA: Chromatin remodeling complex ATPase [Caudoviricetes sp.]
MGLGKTSVTLTAISDMIGFDISKVLVIAPLRVAQTVWDAEAEKWDHTQFLRFSKILGTAKQRRDALLADADVYVINRENIPWLVTECGKRWPFDMVVIDELSSFKSRSAERFKALKKVRPCIERIVGLTGTPAPNGLLDLWPQMYLMDQGNALGKTLSVYRDTYFKPGKRNGNVIFEWKLLPGAEDAIYKRLAGLVVSMKTRDYLKMPERIDNVISIELPPDAKNAYRQMEREMVLPLKNTEITAFNAASVCNKLLQLSGGSVYDENGVYHEIHREKLDALHDVIEAANGNPVLCYYGFRHEAARIMQEFPQARMIGKGENDVRDWNAGKIPLLLCHPDSAGHGLNLQTGGHILVWYDLTWSLEKYQQANARLHRQGQKSAVVIHHIVAKGTVDERVMRILAQKDLRQDALMEAVKAILREDSNER